MKLNRFLGSLAVLSVVLPVAVFAYSNTTTSTITTFVSTITTFVTPPMPVVSISASTLSVATGGTTVITWLATNTTQGCVASGDWSGIKDVSGTFVSSPLTAGMHTFMLTCTGNLGITGSGIVTVNAVSQAPTIASISLTSAKVGDTVYVYGSNFNGGNTYLTIDGGAAYPTFSFISGTSMSFVVPALGAGAHTVAVSEKGGSFGLSSPVTFTVIAPSTQVPATQIFTAPTINTNIAPSSDIQKQIQVLLDQIKALQGQASQAQPVSSNNISTPAPTSAQSDNAPTSSGTSCVALSDDFGYRARDVATNGGVSTLQDFLQSKGFLSSEPTGFFGGLTIQAVKSFQRINGMNPTGYVGPLTRAKIKVLTCGQ